MGRLVANLLDMIRVETGALQVQKEWQLLSDVVGVALLRTEEQLRDHPVTTAFPADLPLVPIDEILLEQVFVNLLENAAKHTPAGTPDRGRRRGPAGRGGRVRRRRGPGLPPGEEEPIFRSSIAAASGGGRHRPRASPSAAASSPRTAGGSGPRRRPAAAPSSGSRCRSPARRRARARRRVDRRSRRMDRPAPLILLIEDEPQMRRFLRTALARQRLPAGRGGDGEGGPRRRPRRATPTSSCSTSGCPTATASRWPASCASGARRRSSCSRRAAASRTRSRRSTSAPTTTSPSRSASRSCSPGSGWRCATRRRRQATRRSRCSKSGDLRVDLAARRVWRAGAGGAPHADRVQAARRRWCGTRARCSPTGSC